MRAPRLPAMISSGRPGSAGYWPAPLIAIHWLTVFAVTIAFSAVVAREWLEGDKALRAALLQIHWCAGLATWLLVVLRIPARLRSRAPDRNSPLALTWAAKIGHALLYIALAAIPVVGYALASARYGSVAIGPLRLPPIIPKDRDMAEWLESLHGYAGWIFLGLIAVHAAAALFHHFVLKDGVLRSMQPSRIFRTT